MHRVSHRIAFNERSIQYMPPPPALSSPTPPSAHPQQLHWKCALSTARDRDHAIAIDTRSTTAGPGAVIGEHVELQSGHRVVAPVGLRDINLAGNSGAGTTGTTRRVATTLSVHLHSVCLADNSGARAKAVSDSA